ncbi:MAG: PepSY domain-containing protein [Bdellovibrionaceae bacterium]|nr:PepSY domain-containing protein [Pseudobdellovibrionaceae bacterium]
MRKWHRWLTVVALLPVGLMVVTGILLMTRGFNTWVQPESQKITESRLDIRFDHLLESLQSHPELGVKSWADVSQIDVRPSSGLFRVRFKKHQLEAQVHPATGEILQVEPRRMGLLVSLHEGAFFGPWVRYGLFLPGAVALLVLYLSGLYLFFQFIQRKYFK